MMGRSTAPSTGLNGTFESDLKELGEFLDIAVGIMTVTICTPDYPQLHVYLLHFDC